MNISSTPTANLMTPFEPILVELVNPTPGYQPGTGKEDGAQIVQGANGCEWWAPELGCDSLDATLEAIRYRISRYLHDTDEIVAAARAALLADGPAVPEGREPASIAGEPSDEELLQLMPEQFRADLSTVSRMAADGAGTGVSPGLFRVILNTGALDFARAILARYVGS